MHTNHSLDSSCDIRRLANAARSKGLAGVAITDHGTIDGALEAKQALSKENLDIIVGEEIATNSGEIVGLFLKEAIRERDPNNVVRKIHDQGGLAVLAHPFRGRTPMDSVVRIVDAIEVFNSRSTRFMNAQALQLANRHNKPMIAGSDAHFHPELGLCTTSIKSRDIREAIVTGDTILTESSSSFFYTALSFLVRSLRENEPISIPRKLKSSILSRIDQV